MSSYPSVERMGESPAWCARSGREPIGRARVVVRPDRRCFVLFEECRADAYEPLLAAVTPHAGADRHVTVNEADESALGLFQRLGFVENRRESTFRVKRGAPRLA